MHGQFCNRCVAEIWQRPAARCGAKETESRRREVETMTEPDSRETDEGGLMLSLWLLAAVVAEAELLLWLLERAYSA
jgi:hypothetical protein